MKNIFKILIAIEAVLFVQGIYFFTVGSYFTGLFCVIINAICICINLKNIKL